LSYAPSRPWLLARDLLIWAAVGLTIYSGVGYLMLAWPALREKPRPTIPATEPTCSGSKP
jgi:hypothetical protein